MTSTKHWRQFLLILGRVEHTVKEGIFPALVILIFYIYIIPIHSSFYNVLFFLTWFCFYPEHLILLNIN